MVRGERRQWWSDSMTKAKHGKALAQSTWTSPGCNDFLETTRPAADASVQQPLVYEIIALQHHLATTLDLGLGRYEGWIDSSVAPPRCTVEKRRDAKTKAYEQGDAAPRSSVQLLVARRPHLSLDPLLEIFLHKSSRVPSVPRVPLLVDLLNDCCGNIARDLPDAGDVG